MFRQLAAVSVIGASLFINACSVRTEGSAATATSAPTSPSSSAATALITSPAAGASVDTSVHFVAASSMSGTVASTTVYVDGSAVYTANSAAIDTYLAVAEGAHVASVQSTDSAGNSVKSPEVTFTAVKSAVAITSPSANATVTSPFTVTATAKMPGSVKSVQVYVDGQLAYTAATNALNAALTVSAGNHNIVVQAADANGNSVKSSTVPVTVQAASSSGGSGDGSGSGSGSSDSGSGSGSGSSGGGASDVPSNALVYSKIEEITGWQSCDVCSGPGGNGSITPYSLTQSQATPSMDGNSAKFSLGGTTPYASALWWKQLGPQPSTTHFVYDLYFYYTDADAVQALEFDVNQSVDGKKYIFGTQCSPRHSGTWDVWDNTAQQWISTGVACPAPPTYTWNHLVWQFERTSDNRVHFVAVTLNGKTSYIDQYYTPLASGAKELNVAFQMDGNYQQKNYEVWLDQVKLSAW